VSDRKRVYIAGSISKGDLATNVNQGTLAFLHLTACGFAPFAPQWSVFSTYPCQPATNGVVALGTAAGMLSHDDWLAVDLSWVGVADIVLRLPGESKGADEETALAESLGIPVAHSVHELCGPTLWHQEVSLAGVQVTARAYRECDLVHVIRHLCASHGVGTPDFVGVATCE